MVCSTPRAQNPMLDLRNKADGSRSACRRHLDGERRVSPGRLTHRAYPAEMTFEVCTDRRGLATVACGDELIEAGIQDPPTDRHVPARAGQDRRGRSG